MHSIINMLGWGSAWLLAAGCSTQQFRASADREAYRLIAEKTARVPNMDPQFTIATNVLVTLEGLPVVRASDESLGASASMEVGARILSLRKALEIAVRNSRTYQNRKETLYLQALALSLDRHRYTPIFSGNAAGDYSGRRLEVQQGIDRLTTEQKVSANAGLGSEMWLRSGGKIAASLTSDFLRYLTGDPRVANSSALAATLSQPLLRGAGYRVAMENLTQAERNLLYALREFTQFRKEFTVQVAAAYYNALQNRDVVRNTWRGYLNFKENVRRERAFAEEGQRTQAALGRLRQAELNTESSWINAVRNYRQNLDQFKILLGLSTDIPLILDETELERLQIVHPSLSVEDAVRIALGHRLDLDTVRDQWEDAARKIDLAANGFLPDLDLVLSSSVASKPGSGLPQLDFQRVSWNAGLDLKLPLDRKAERNSYRGALIAYDRAVRQLELSVDQIKLDINDGWRNLDQAKRNYEISLIGVDLSDRRVAEEELKAQLGRGIAKDQVDAQTDLINSRNDRTRALVGHTIARLQFWRDMGVLDIQPDGQWTENLPPP